MLGIIFFYSLLVLFSVNNSISWMFEWKLDCFEVFDLSIVLCFDTLSSSFLFTVFVVSFLVFSYSQSYLSENYNKFIILLFLFVMSMCLLCLSSSLFWILMGWDGLGLTSFCLILFYQNWNSFNSGLITFLINRLGDMFLIVGICLLLNGCSLVLMESFFPMTIVSLLVVTGALTKSAQLPFCSWLPLAMAAPTPVSSLVHSSTLVTAGVYLLIRFECLLTMETLSILNLVSSLTILYAGITALGECDLKKIVALSTMMHLGIMMLYISIGSSLAAMIHLMFHAFFKSALFMLSGIMIHMSGLQDIRIMKSMPLLKSLLLYVLMSMSGLPFFTGFYSKEVMLGLVSNDSMILTIVFLSGVILTVAYSARMIYYISKSPMLVIVHEKEIYGVSMEMMSYCGVMVSVLGGFLLWIVLPVYTCMLNSLHTYLWFKAFMLILIFSGVMLGLVMTVQSVVKDSGYWSMWHLTTTIQLVSYSVTKTFHKMGRVSDMWGVLDWFMLELVKNNLMLKHWNELLLGKSVFVMIKWLILVLLLSLALL
uniref:NADH-ubiquinone oxidoreductase chain 5 n=1 Tax=Haematopinus quadripertusus TaxID=1453187 RepID=A0AAU7YSF6_9NEOP